MKRRVSPTTAIACLALFFSLVGTGMAAQHYLISSLSQIAPKVRHELRGPRGHTGPRGTQGAPGTPGSKPFFSTIHEQVVVSPDQTEPVTVQASCPSGPAVGGGYDTQPGLLVTESRPLILSEVPTIPPAILGDHGNVPWGWVAAASNPSDAALTLTAWAVCVTYG